MFLNPNFLSLNFLIKCYNKSLLIIIIIIMMIMIMIMIIIIIIIIIIIVIIIIIMGRLTLRALGK